MKKILFAALVACFSMNASAQIAVEVMTDPFGGFTFNGGKVRYFLDESSAVRATINFNTNANTTNPAMVIPTAENTPVGLDAAKALFDIRKDNFTKATTTNFNLHLGYEKVLANVGKTSFYAGAEILFEKTWNKTYSETAAIDPTAATPTKAATDTDKTTWGSLDLGLGVFGGIDYDITDNLYVGLESGLGCLYTVNSNRTNEAEVWNAATKATVKTTNETEIKDNTLDLKLYLVPALRIGWKF